ncbi:hypothetical protein LBMAG46_33810 [Planctomycetia bacterium]|nr:hypothetical protein LBMAG46_33810 [Planctomycetia bacterium]
MPMCEVGGVFGLVAIGRMIEVFADENPGCTFRGAKRDNQQSGHLWQAVCGAVVAAAAVRQCLR